jgi:hypothetical protein
MSRGQEGLEYVITYGWVVLAILIVGVVIYELRLANLASDAVSSSGFVKIKPQTSATGMKHDGSFNGVFTNGFSNRINVSLEGIVMSDSYSTNCTASGSTVSVGPSQQFLITTGPGCGIEGNVGEVYTLTLTIPYSINIGGAESTHTETGIIRAPFE